MSIRLIQVNDVHVQDQRVVSRLDDPTETVFRKLNDVYELARTHKAHVVIAGDLFNQKSPWRVSHKLVLRLAHLIDSAYSWGIETLILPGTHDLTYGQLESLSKQPLGVLFKACNAQYIEPGLNEFELMSVEDSDKEKILIWGAPGVYELDKPEGNEMYRFSLVNAMPEQCGLPRVAVSHGMLLKPGEEFFGDYTTMEWVAEKSDAQVHMNGHPHWEQGFVEVGGVLFSNPGSLFRGAMTADALKRTIKVAIFEFEDGKLTDHDYLLVPHDPASAVFSVDMVDSKNEAKVLKQFEDSVNDGVQSLGAVTTAEDIIRLSREMDVSESVVEVIRDYLDRAEATI